MALNTLTLGASSGYIGRPFSTSISGRTAGSRIEVVCHDGNLVFYVLNSALYCDALPYDLNAIVLRETASGLGSKDTAVSITGYSIDEPAPQPPADGTANIANGSSVSVQNSAGADAHSATAAVTGNTLSGVKLAATVAMVDSADAVTVQNSAGTAVAGTHSATVAAGVLSNVKLAATIAPVASGSQAVTDAAGKSSTATRTVAAGVVSGEVLAATDCIVKNGNTFTTADGGTLTVAVAAGVPTFTYTAP